MKLTKRQQQMLTFLDDSLQRHGIMPSTREIQEHFGFASQTAVLNHLRALERKDAIQRQAGKARGIVLTSVSRRGRMVDVPVFGSIAAGMASPAEQMEEGMVSINAALLGSSGKGSAANGLFALRVRGDSMINAHICDGDLVVLEIREPRDGDIVAALIDGETTLKRYVVRRDRPYLKAENPAYPDLIPAQELIVQGVLRALVRAVGGK